MKNEVTWSGKYSDGAEWPDWFRAAIDDGRLTPNVDKSLAIQTIKGTLYAEVGDVVKLLPNGALMRYKGEGAR